jgi:hypothetical protein
MFSRQGTVAAEETGQQGGNGMNPLTWVRRRLTHRATDDMTILGGIQAPRGGTEGTEL